MKKIHLINREIGKRMYATCCGLWLSRRDNERYFTRSKITTTRINIFV